jgi:hypothetical protein
MSIMTQIYKDYTINYYEISIFLILIYRLIFFIDVVYFIKILMLNIINIKYQQIILNKNINYHSIYQSHSMYRISFYILDFIF